MKIKRITATNLKGKTFSHELGDATAIIGPNFSGKTAILEAIRLVLMGYIPEVGKLPKATWELSSGAEMVVRVDFGNGHFSRQFWLDGSKVNTSISDNSEKLEPDFANLPLMQSDRYFGMTDSERTAYVFERIQLPDSYTADAIIAEAHRLSFGDEHTHGIEISKADCIEDLRDCFITDEASGEIPTIQQALSKAINIFKERFTHWNRRAKDTQGAVTTYTELKLREPEVVAAAQGISEEIVATQDELDRLNVVKGKLTAQKEEAGRIAARKDVLRKFINAERPDYAKKLQMKQAEKENAEGKLEPELSPEKREHLRRQMKETDTRAQLNAEILEADKIIERAERQLAELSELDKCPYCQSVGKDWKENLSATAKEDIRKSTRARESATETRIKITQSVTKLEEQLDADMRASEVNVQLKLVAKAAAEEIVRLQSAKASDEARMQEMEVELAELVKLPSPANLDAELDRTINEFTTLRTKLTRLEASKEAEMKLKQDLRRAAQAQLEHEEADAHVLVIKAIQKLVNEKREAMITDVFGSLLKVANQVCGDILRTPLDLHENTVGRWDGSKFIPHRVFSGTERALCYISIAVALSAQSPLRLVILDEFGRLDDANKVLVCQNLMKCVEGSVIDQFIIVGTGLPAAMPSSMKVIEVKA